MQLRLEIWVRRPQRLVAIEQQQMGCGVPRDQLNRRIDRGDQVLRLCDRSSDAATPIQHTPELAIGGSDTEASQVAPFTVQEEARDAVPLCREPSVLHRHTGVRESDRLANAHGWVEHAWREHDVSLARYQAGTALELKSSREVLPLHHDIANLHCCRVRVGEAVAFLIGDHAQVVALYAHPLNGLAGGMDQGDASAALDNAEQGRITRTRDTRHPEPVNQRPVGLTRGTTGRYGNAILTRPGLNIKV